MTASPSLTPQSPSPGSSSPSSLRSNLRQASLIIPQTGARVKRRITLRSADGQNNGAASIEGVPTARTPLLGGRGSQNESTVTRGRNYLATRAITFWAFARSETGLGVLKCSLAYLLGSMATFIPAIRNTLGQQDGKHMVATIAVYFHPARSRGSMYEALICAFSAFAYASFMCIASMGVSVFFADTLDLMPVGHVIVLIVFCGGGLGFVGWVKQRQANPLVNIACSLTSLAMITVLTKEGAVQRGDFSFAKISQVLKMIMMGVVATMAVSFLVFPISATQKLRQNMIDVTDSLADILALITTSFLSGFEEELEQTPFKSAVERHKKAYGSLGKNVREAKFEHYVAGRERQYRVEAKLVQCVQRVTQSIGGLKSAASMQFSLVKQPMMILSRSKSDLGNGSTYFTTPSSTPYTATRMGSSEDFGGLAAIAEQSEDEISQDRPLRQDSMFRSPAEIFELFIGQFGPSMKSLAFTLKEILDELPYDSAARYNIKINPTFRISLNKAIELYKTSRKEALELIYSQKVLTKHRPIEIEADYEEVAASCGHFSFSLLEVAEQMKEYLDALDELHLEIEERPEGRTWAWMKFWRPYPQDDREALASDIDSATNLDQAENLNVEVHLPSTKERPDSPSLRSWQLPTKAKLGYKLWRSLRPLRRDDVKFAIKVGGGAALYALPSFLAVSRPVYSHWRGEWGLLSYMLVCSMTIGASNTTGWSRFLGTCLGAILAIFAWDVSQGNVFGMAVIGWVMSYWTAYIIVGLGKGPMGRFIMLTYNLSALYAYSLSVQDEKDDDDEGGTHPLIADIAAHRVVAVLSGVVWGLIITRLVWPISARSKLKDGLSLIWLRMGLMWKRDPLSSCLEGGTPNAYMNVREEFELQRYLSRLEKLRDSAKSEYDLRGPFAENQYSKILRCTGNMIDAFHAMNVVIMKDLNASDGKIALLHHTTKQRAQLCARISHLFSVLASSMKLQYPLNDALPNTEHTRDRLLAGIFTFRRHDIGRDVPDEDFSLLYAYALVTGQLSREIKAILKEVENLFGVLDEELLKLQ